MPSNVTNLDEIVGTDHIFKIGGHELVMPGDPETKTVFSFLELWDRLNEAQDAAKQAAADAEKAGEDVIAAISGKREDIERLLLEVRAKLLLLFQERDPTLTDLPFGHKATMVVLSHALKALGVTVEPEAPLPPKEKPAVKRATSVKKKPAAKASRR